MSYYEVLKDINDTGENIDKVSQHNKIFGGGFLWIVLYWPLYFTFIYELIDVKEKITTASEIFGILLFFSVGVFLTLGVRKHIQLNSLLYEDMSEDFRNTIEKHKGELFEAIDKELKRPMPQYGIFNAQVKNLNNSIERFRKKYFEKKYTL